MLHQIFLFLGQLWQLFEVSQILEFLRYQVALQAFQVSVHRGTVTVKVQTKIKLNEKCDP